MVTVSGPRQKKYYISWYNIGCYLFSRREAVKAFMDEILEKIGAPDD